MEPEIPVVPPIDDEAALDALIDADVSKIRAEQPGAANPSEPATDPKGEEGAGDPTAKDPIDPQVPADQGAQPTDNAPAFELKTPVKGKFESDASFEIRQNLFELVKQKKAARDPGEASDIERQIAEIREGFKTIKTITNPKDSNAPEVVQPSPAAQDDSVVRKEDLPKILEEMRAETEAKVTIDSFFEKHPELSDKDVRDAFTDFFDLNFKLEGKDSKGISQVLEIAHAAMFRPNESIQERVIAGANVNEKVNAMQFPGGTLVQTGLTPEQDASVKEMVAAGVPEDKARELILD